MSRPYRKARAGQIPIPSRTVYNQTLDLLDRAEREFDRVGAGQGIRPVHRDGAILVKNTSGGALSRFAVVGLDAPVIAAGDNLASFQQTIAIKAITPSTADFSKHTDSRWAVIVEPLDVNAIGWAVVSGIVPVQVNLDATWHFRCDIIHNDATKLKSYPGGAARILGIDRGSTGDKWAYVQLGVNPYVAYECVLDAQLNSGSSAAASLYFGATDTTETVTVYAPAGLSSGNIASGKKLRVSWNPQRFRLEPDWAAEC